MPCIHLSVYIKSVHGFSVLFIYGIFLAVGKEKFLTFAKKNWLSKTAVACAAALVLGVAYLKFKGVVFFGDYLVAYAVLGVAGCFKGKFVPATLLACAARYLVHYVVGATVWGEYMPEEFFGMTMTTPWFYSLLYNGCYILPCTVLVLVGGLLLMKTPVKKYLIAQEN